jgi:pyruvate kinase
LVKCCLEAERTIDWRKAYNDIKLYSPGPYGSAESVACASVASVLDLKVDLIVVATETGKLARMVAKYKPCVPIVCVSQSEVVVQQVAIQSGVFGVLASQTADQDEQLNIALADAKKSKLAESGAKIVTITATNEDTQDETNIMKIMSLE